MDVSKNGGTPKASKTTDCNTKMGPFWGILMDNPSGQASARSKLPRPGTFANVRQRTTIKNGDS